VEETENNQEPGHSDRVTVGQAEDALGALANLLYLIEIDHKNEVNLEAYLIMARTRMKILNKWLYDDPCRGDDGSS
jgi:hypothetical protein